MRSPNIQLAPELAWITCAACWRSSPSSEAMAIASQADAMLAAASMLFTTFMREPSPALLLDDRARLLRVDHHRDDHVHVAFQLLRAELPRRALALLEHVTDRDVETLRQQRLRDAEPHRADADDGDARQGHCCVRFG